MAKEYPADFVMPSEMPFGALLNKQIEFQKRLGNKLPDSPDNVCFECVQLSLSHNVYQSIEFQEFSEANKFDRKEELIDYLLFMLNKYIYLGINAEYAGNAKVRGNLFYEHSNASFCQCASFAQLEFQSYLSLIRSYTTFKPWKVRKDASCTSRSEVEAAFCQSIRYFCSMADIVFDDYGEFYETLCRKLTINEDRQNSNY